jgi:hypothetical protein
MAGHSGLRAVAGKGLGKSIVKSPPSAMEAQGALDHCRDELIPAMRVSVAA